MNKTCVCIEGQLRGSKRCGPTIKKYLVEKLNADLYLFLQNYEKHKEYNIKYYGNPKKVIIYDNPYPNFEKIFDNLCNKFNCDKSKWRETFTKLIDGNYMLGYEKPGTCIRRMYNRYLIFNELQNSDYEWFVILRSDLYFVDYFYDLSQLKNDCLNLYKKGDWGGLNNNFLVFHKSLFENVLNYIKFFLNGNVLNYYLNNYDNSDEINEEKFFHINMKINNIKFNYIENMWYISADDLEETTTWAKIQKSNNGDYFKYNYDYLDAINKIKQNK